MNRDIVGIAPKAADLLGRYGWPGNVRELENAMERAAALAHGKRVGVEDLPEDIRRPGEIAAPTPAAMKLAEVERAHILTVMAANEGNQGRAATALGIGVSTLYRKLKRYSADARSRDRAGSPSM